MIWFLFALVLKTYTLLDGMYIIFIECLHEIRYFKPFMTTIGCHRIVFIRYVHDLFYNISVNRET